MRRVAAALAALIVATTSAFAASSTVPAMTAAGVLTGAELVYCVQSSADARCTTQAVADANAINPLAGYNASGSNATTTGSITSGLKALTVGSATGWSVGMGIAVTNAGPGGNTELISSVTACGANASGVCGSTSFTLNDAASATATTQAVNHDDTAAISAAITAALSNAKPLHLQGTTGCYNVTSGLTALSTSPFIYGDGEYTSVICNRSKTGNIFTINFQNSDLNTGPITVSGLIRNIGIKQASGITPTGGAAFFIASAGGTSGSPKFYVTGLRMQDVLIQGTWEGIETGDGVAQNVFSNVRIANTVSGCGIKYNSNQPSGDNNWDDVQLFEVNTSLCIAKADTQTWTNLKLNGSGIVFSGASASAIFRQRFTNTSIEGVGGSPSCAIDFGSNGATQIEFRGGEIGGINTPLCHGVTAGSNVTGGLSVHMLLTDGGFNAIGTLDVETGLPTSCSGLITGRIANVSGAMTVCP